MASISKQGKCSTAVAEKEPFVLNGWEIPDIRNNIVSFCSPHPWTQFNQIAVADRRCNTAWRRRNHPFCERMLRAAIHRLGNNARSSRMSRSIVLLLDTEGVLYTAHRAQKLLEIQLERLREAARAAGRAPLELAAASAAYEHAAAAYEHAAAQEAALDEQLGQQDSSRS